MTVLTSAVSGITPLTKGVIRIKPISQTRPVTATLKYPAILDITFLKKLDMTSFTKKGLIAISKICGISLVRRTDDKKIRKRLKRHMADRVKKEARKKSLRVETSGDYANKNESGAKWTTPKTLPENKVSEVSANRTKIERKSFGPRARGKDSKPSVDDILYGPVSISVTEPCKTCGRSEHPERFHSHPKQVPGKKQQSKGNSRVFETPSQAPDEKLLVPPASKSTTRRHSIGHVRSEHTSKLHVVDIEISFHSDHEIERNVTLPKSKTLRQISKEKEKLRGRDEEGNQPAKRATENKRADSRTSLSQEDKTSGYCSQEDIKYVTDCYVCGKQMSHETRISHEEACIVEWRRQNHQLPPDERKVEPVRCDLRFTESEDTNTEGTFKSVWANHMDSLVRCTKCRRTFFPDRIERHEACCNQKLSKQNYPTPRNKLNN